MFFCWAQELQNEFLYSAKYLLKLQQTFILTPIIRFKDKKRYDETLSHLTRIGENIIVKPIYLKSPNSSFSNLFNPKILINDFLSIAKVVRQMKPEVVVCFYVSHAYPLVLLKRLSKFSLCTVAMGSDINLENGFLQKNVRKLIYRNCELIFARSGKLKDKIEEEHKCNVIVNPSSADSSFFKPLKYKTALREKWNIPSNIQLILTVCRLDKNKGVDILLKALPALKDYNIKVLIVGEGTEKKNLEKLTDKTGLQEKIIFMGLRDKQELLELYNLSDIFTLTSYSEGLPRVLIEAMACGCIPVATNVGSICNLVINGYNGFTLPPGNYSALSEKIKAVLSLPEIELKKMQTRARSSVVENFDSKKIWEHLVETIRTSIVQQHE